MPVFAWKSETSLLIVISIGLGDNSVISVCAGVVRAVQSIRPIARKLAARRFIVSSYRSRRIIDSLPTLNDNQPAHHHSGGSNAQAGRVPARLVRGFRRTACRRPVDARQRHSLVRGSESERHLAPQRPPQRQAERAEGAHQQGARLRESERPRALADL